MSLPAQAELHTASSPPHDLAGILTPLQPGEFLASHYGTSFRHVPGPRGKFSALLPWPVLNNILEQHRLEPPRLRLTREGRSVPPESYLSWQPNRRKNAPPIGRLNSVALARELRDGATLVLDAVDELYRPIRRLAESLERVFRVRVQVNAYAGWRTSHGFDLHWDDHDVFILQIAGRKHWKVYGMTRKYPLARDIEPTLDPPSEVLWESLLEDGDLLYIPRGWWHVATPLDEPTLHLTVGVTNLTGADLLSWFTERLRAAEDVRRDIPHWRGPDAQREFAERVRSIFLDAWRPEVLDEFLGDADGKSRPRPHFSLPWVAAADVLDNSSLRIRWNGARNIPIKMVDEGEIAIEAHGRRWIFRAEARPLLAALLPGGERSLEEIYAAADGIFERPLVRIFVKELLTSGLLVSV